MILLAALLLLLVALLLMRLNYSVNAEYDDGIAAQASLSVLFGALKLTYRYGGDNEGLEAKIFGRELKKKADKAPSEEDVEESPREVLQDSVKDAPEDSSKNDSEDISESISENISENNSENNSEDVSENISEDTPTEKKEKPKKTKKKRVKKAKKENIFDKIKSAYDSFQYFRERYDIPLLLSNIKIYVVQQCLSLGVQGGSIGGILGLDDPSKTGMVLGGIGIIGAFAPIETDISGEFERKYIALNGSLYGRTYLLKLALPVLKLIFKRPVRTIIYDILFKKGSKR